MSFLKDFKELTKDISGTKSGNEDKGSGTVTPTVTDTQSAVVQSEKTEQITKTEERNMSDIGKEMPSVDRDLTVIAAGTILSGSLTSSGSVAVYGQVDGDINCQKKLIAGGVVNGTIHAAEVFINKATVDGDVVSDGNIKIGTGSVIVGNVYGQTAVIAGAVKGEIDIQGPVIIDNTAVVQGNVKSRSVQINNGAVIEGYCTQCYREVDVNSIFKETFPGVAVEEQTLETVQEMMPEQMPEGKAVLMQEDFPVETAAVQTESTDAVAPEISQEVIH